MLTLHRMFIKTALAHLVAGSGLGAWLMWKKAWGGPLPNHVFITVHNHLIVVGFFLMIVMGVAYWMFPRQAGTTPREAARDPLAWAGYVSLNTGLLMRAFVEPFATGETQPLLALSALRQMAAIFLFILAIWKRVRMPRLVPPKG